MELNIKNVKKDFKSKGIYYTPKALAEKLKGYLPEDVMEVYDPTCGQGNLLAVFDKEVKKFGQDINESEIEKAKKALDNFEGYTGDTLTEPKFDRTFDYIVGNPPFSIEWNPVEIWDRAPIHPTKSRADYAFIIHILKHLNKKAVVLNFPGILYRKAREQQIRKWLVEEGWIEVIEEIPGDTFVDTKIETALIVFNKEKKSKSIKFKNKHGEREVNYKEIKENNYDLSPKTYIDTPDTREKIDIVELNQAILLSDIRKRASTLMIDKHIESIDNAVENHIKAELNVEFHKEADKLKRIADSLYEVEYRMLATLELLLLFKDYKELATEKVKSLESYKNIEQTIEYILKQSEKAYNQVNEFVELATSEKVKEKLKIEELKKYSELRVKARKGISDKSEALETLKILEELRELQ